MCWKAENTSVNPFTPEAALQWLFHLQVKIVYSIMSVQPTIAKCYVFTDRWLGCVKRETDKLIDYEEGDRQGDRPSDDERDRQGDRPSDEERDRQGDRPSDDERDKQGDRLTK